VPTKKPGNGELLPPEKKRRVHDRDADEQPPYMQKTGRGARGGSNNGHKLEDGSEASRGRPEAEIDDATRKLIYDLAAIGCPVREISHVTKIPVSTLNRRWLSIVEDGRMNRNVSLRKKQFNKAMAGDNTMLIWTGKQLLGQTDKLQASTDPENPLPPTQIIVEFV
jgi:hypothetical protein